MTEIFAALEEQKVVDLTPENRKALQDMLQLSIESHEECPICLESLHTPVITACAHVFGHSCIERVIETQHRCPMCRAEPLTPDSLVHPAIDLGESANPPTTSSPSSSSSSKVDALLSILHASHTKDPTTKTVIFSQWTSFLDIIGTALTARFLPFTRIDGSMRSPARDAAMASFSTPSPTSPHILLASLAVCSVGLNLVAANQVILADSWWAPAIEDQAVDRVHRLGQEREVTVWRLVMEGSIEERVLGVQSEKRRLAGMALREKGGKKRGGGEGRVGDIQRLLGPVRGSV